MKKRFLLLLVLFSLSCQTAIAQPQSQIRNVDFRNFTYPGIWMKGPIRLQEGKGEAESKGCHSEYTYQRVDYRDFNGDGKEEALIQIRDFTACGSSGVSTYYYVYEIRNKRPRLLWRFSTGSEAHGGLKEFHISGKHLVFELYGNYRVAGARAKAANFPRYCCPDCCPEKYTRIVVWWSSKGFKQRKVEVFPFPYTSISDYEQRGRG